MTRMVRMTSPPWNQLHEILEKDLQEISNALDREIEVQDWEAARTSVAACLQIQTIVVELCLLELSGDVSAAVELVAAYVEAKKDQPE